MSFQNAYLNSVMDDLRARYAHEPEYLQAVEEFLEPLSPRFCTTKRTPGGGTWLWWARPAATSWAAWPSRSA